jgi:hypothetical protein
MMQIGMEVPIKTKINTGTALVDTTSNGIPEPLGKTERSKKVSLIGLSTDIRKPYRISEEKIIWCR